jgi:hypothetical protein
MPRWSIRSQNLVVKSFSWLMEDAPRQTSRGKLTKKEIA